MAYVHCTLSTPHRSTRLCIVKLKHHARCLKHRRSRRTRVYASEEELFAAVRLHLAKARLRKSKRERRQQAKLSSAEKEFLTGITTSGAFTLEATLGMYAEVRRISDGLPVSS
jgi:hypothetical protein